MRYYHFSRLVVTFLLIGSFTLCQKERLCWIRCNYKFRTGVILLFLTGFFFSTGTYSQEKITVDERPLLPKWCNHVQGFESDQKTTDFMNQVGRENWQHLHHYCYGLVQIFRSHSIGLTQEKRNFHLEQAINEIDYVLRNASPTFTWRPELLTKRGSALLALKNYIKSEESLLTATKENPNYWPPYGYLADLYLEQGKIDKARSILQAGLKISPNAKGLKIRMVKLEQEQDRSKNTTN